MSDVERDIDAAERALGLEPLRGEDREGRAAREAWDLRFAPLLDAVEPVAPPDGLLGRIEARIEALTDKDGTVVELARMRRRLRLWKGTAAAAASVAAALALWIAVPANDMPARYVAVVTSDADGTAGMIIEFDTGSGLATVIPVGLTAPEGRALEMWQLPNGAERPHSLGLLPDTPVERRTIQAGPGDVFAISFEQPGGSPTGQPTDPRFHGTIVQVE